MLRWLILCCCLAGPIAAQQTPQVLTIDSERLFADTRFGARAEAEIEAEARTLAAENRQIEADLASEERDLTRRRPAMDASEFQNLADAFDEKVQRIRIEQDAKARALGQARDEAEQAFFREIAGILGQIVRERGAYVILEQRDVFLSADAIDVTEEAIRRINASLGDGNGSGGGGGTGQDTGPRIGQPQPSDDGGQETGDPAPGQAPIGD